MDDQQTQQDLPESRKALIFTFNITGMNAKKSIEDSVEDLKPLMLLVLYFIDKIKRFRLSREAKNKADKNRTKVQEAFWKSIHAAKGNFEIYKCNFEIYKCNFEIYKCNFEIYNVAFEFWHFPPIFVLLKLTCLVTLFDRKLQVFKNSSKLTILGIDHFGTF